LGLSRHAEAKKAYDAGLKLDPDNAQLKKGAADAETAEKGNKLILSIYVYYSNNKRLTN
jgi:cytochrome c-type biogenesis protein CcmH/NrfG